MNIEDLLIGKIYFIDYGGTQIIGRLQATESVVGNLFFYDYLHYWAGREEYRKNNPYCVTAGIQEIREASPAEKHTLLRFSIEHNTI